MSEFGEVTVAFKRKTEDSPRLGRGDERTPGASPVSTLVSEDTTKSDAPRPAPSADGTNSNGTGNTTTSSKIVSGPYKGRLGDLLIEKGLITPEQLDLVLAEQKENGGKLGELLVSMNMLDPHALADCLATYFGLVVVDLRRENVDSEVITLVPESMAREQLAIPVRSEADGLYVAVAEPSDELRALLAKTTSRRCTS